MTVVVVSMRRGVQAHAMIAWLVTWWLAPVTVLAQTPPHATAQAQPVPSAAPPSPKAPPLQFRVSPTEVITGDVVHIELKVRSSRYHTVRFELPPEFANFAVRSRNEATHTDDKTATVTHTLRVQLLATTPTQDTGAQPVPTNHSAPDGMIPPLEASLRAPDGTVHTLRTQSTRVTVRSVLAGRQGQLTPKPATDPHSLWVWNVRAIAAALGIAGLVLALWMTWRFTHRRSRATRAPLGSAPGHKQVSAWQRALQTIERLRREQLDYLARGQGPTWADALSDCLRECLGSQYGFDGLHCTSEEALSAMRARGVDPALVSTGQTTLSACDLVKFAKSPLTPSSCDTLIAQAKEVVQRMQQLDHAEQIDKAAHVDPSARSVSRGEV